MKAAFSGLPIALKTTTTRVDHAGPSEARMGWRGRKLSEATGGCRNVSGVIGSAVVAGILYTLCR